MTPVDARLYVQRARDLAQIETGLSHGFNVILLGERGAGKTTLLNVLSTQAEATRHKLAFVSGGTVSSAADALDRIGRELDPTGNHAASAPAISPGAADPLTAAYDRLAHVVSHLEWNRPVVLLDHLTAPLGWELFGRLRDELWTLELQWVVAANIDDQVLMLAPPADAFFEHTVYLSPFSESDIVELLARRDPGGELGDSVRQTIAARCEGNPSRALALARRAVLAEDPLTAVSRGTVVEQVALELGRPAARLADELARNGPAGPSDEDLLRRLGWSRPRAYQVFEQLNGAGHLEISAEHTGRPGRPRNTYKLKEDRV
jgi:energy-coupling factor transporter ATP-binding protein EcfA2